MRSGTRNHIAQWAVFNPRGAENLDFCSLKTEICLVPKKAISHLHSLREKYIYQWKCVCCSLYFRLTTNVHPGTMSSLPLDELGSPAGNQPTEESCHFRTYPPVCLPPPLCELTWVVALILKTSLSLSPWYTQLGFFFFFAFKYPSTLTVSSL